MAGGEREDARTKAEAAGRSRGGKKQEALEVYFLARAGETKLSS